MQRKRRRLVLAAIPLLVILAGATQGRPPKRRFVIAASPPGCLPQDSIALDIRDELIDLMGRSSKLSDSILKHEGITRVPTSQISIVSDTLTCRRAAQAYSGSISAADSNRLVDVVKAGIRFVVIDPAVTSDSSEWKTAITFDSSFTHSFMRFQY